MRDVFSTLPPALRALGANEDALNAVVFAAWNRAVGSGLSEQTAPLRFDGKVLTVAVSSETWKKNIADLAGQILFKLNGAIGSRMVSYVEFTVDSLYVRARNQTAAPSRSNNAYWESLVTKELSPSLENAANEISDGGLRRQFLRASANSLARQKLNSERVTINGR